MSETNQAGSVRGTRYRQLSYYDYFAWTRGPSPSDVDRLLGRSEVCQAINLFVYSGLPLAAAVIYVGHAVRDQRILPPPYDFTPSRGPSKRGFGSFEAVTQEYPLTSAWTVKQLARHLALNIGTNELAKAPAPPLWTAITFPKPLDSHGRLIEWMAEIGVSYLAEDKWASWRICDLKDRQEYLRDYWVVAFHSYYQRMLDDRKLLACIMQRG